MKKKIIIYQVLPRLFGNKKNNNKKSGTIEENGCGKLNDFDTNALKSIKKIGITHIWYTGIIEHATKTNYSNYGIKQDHKAVVKGQAGSPYAIKDYYDIDPDLAENIKNRLSEYDSLVKRTHDCGLKIIMDFVPNHVARQYHSDAKPLEIKDLGEEDITEVSYNKDNNFYYMPGISFEPSFNLNDEEKNPYIEKPAKVTGNNCFSNKPSINDWYETIKINYGIDYLNHHQDFFPTPNTWIKMRDILVYWTKKGIDGFRCDMAEMVPVEFWNWVIPQVKDINKDVIFIAETYDPNQYGNYLNTGHFDYLYDKVGLYDTLKGVMKEEQPTSNITNCWQQHPTQMDQLLNFLENHDEQRIASDFFANNAYKGLPAMLISATISNGPVMLYSGQELGEKGMDEEGFSGRDGRTSIFDYWSIDTIRRWNNSGKFNNKLLNEEEKELQSRYSKLLNICLQEPALSNGCFYDLMYCNYENESFNSMKQYVFLRKYKEDLLLIVSNFEETNQNITVIIPQEAFDYLNIKTGNLITAKELLKDEEEEIQLNANEPISLSLSAMSGCIWKMKIK